MRIRRALITIALAAVGAAALTWATVPMSTTERVVRIEAAKAQPELADELDRWSVEVNAALYEYAGDERLTLAAQHALATYPDAAETVLGLYGTAEPFQEVLREYGASAVLPIQYFLEHDSWLLRLRHRVTGGVDEGRASRGADQGSESGLTPNERGWYAIGFIQEEGHDFLGQFVVNDAAQVEWVQSERFATATKRFFTSGITTLESKSRRDEAIGAGDYAWAAVDVAVPIAAFRVAKAARGARLARAGGRTIRLAPAAGVGLTLGTAGYMVTHPSLVGDMARGIAEALSLPGWIVELTIWFAILLPLLIAGRFLYRWLIRPVRRMLLLTMALGGWLHRRLAPAPPT